MPEITPNELEEVNPTMSAASLHGLQNVSPGRNDKPRYKGKTKMENYEPSGEDYNNSDLEVDWKNRRSSMMNCTMEPKLNAPNPVKITSKNNNL